MVGTTVRGGALEEQTIVTTFVDLLKRQKEFENSIIVFAAENAPG